ncbi:hypothetical protein HK100_001322 [Physocladia obscura]|uniref:F-box domain-containing protein n=1 Tax=Physocladia obscura TaxID=109957 RepID=A0AAD5SXA4_9FUNG|nr:hypothetical protein HK100_001322 [Physocladia obscura]
MLLSSGCQCRNPPCVCCIRGDVLLMLLFQVLQELSEYRHLLFQPPINLPERISEIQLQIEAKKHQQHPESFIMRPKHEPKTLQSMPPEILELIVELVDAADIIPLSHSMRYYHQSLSDVFKACKAVAEVCGRRNFAKIWPTFEYPRKDFRLSRQIYMEEAVAVFNLMKCLKKYGGDTAVATEDSYFFVDSASTLFPRLIQVDLETARYHTNDQNQLEPPNQITFDILMAYFPSHSHFAVLKVDARSFFCLPVTQNRFVTCATGKTIFSLVLVHVVQQPVHVLKNLGSILQLSKLEILRTTVGVYRIDYAEFPLLDILKTCEDLREIVFANTGSVLADKRWIRTVFLNLKFARPKFRKFVFRIQLARGFWEKFALVDNWSMNFVAHDHVVWEKYS